MGLLGPFLGHSRSKTEMLNVVTEFQIYSIKFAPGTPADDIYTAIPTPAILEVGRARNGFQ